MSDMENGTGGDDRKVALMLLVVIGLILSGAGFVIATAAMEAPIMQIVRLP